MAHDETTGTRRNDGCPDGSCPLNGAASGGYDEGGEYSGDLLSCFMNVEDEEKPEMPIIQPITDLVPKELVISDRCLQLGYMIGPETRKQSPRQWGRKVGFEVGGFFLVDPDDKEFTFHDFIVPMGLPVTTGDIRVAEHYDQTARENKRNNERRGTNLRLGAMFHIHPVDNDGGLYHSMADDQSLDSLLNKMAKTTRTVHESPFPLIQEQIRREYGNGELCLKGDALSDAIVRFIYPNDQMFFEALKEFGIEPDPRDFKKAEFLARLLDTIGNETYEPRLVNFAVSFVFNNGRKGPFVKMAAQEKYVFSKKEKVQYLSDLPIRVVGKDIHIPTKKEVAEIVATRVKFPEIRWATSIPGRKGGKGIVAHAVRGTANLAYKVDLNHFDDHRFLEEPNQRVDYQHNLYVAAPARPNTLAERVKWLEELHAKRESPQPPNFIDEKVEGEVFESLIVGQSATNEKPKLPAGVIEKQRKYEQYLEEFAAQFVFALAAYVQNYRSAECKYSTYAGELLDKMGKFKSTTNWLALSDKSGSKNYAGLFSSVWNIGEIVQDNPHLVERPEIKFYSLKDAIDNITEEIVALGTENGLTSGFMKKFINAREISEQNNLLEIYVTAVHTPDPSETKDAKGK